MLVLLRLMMRNKQRFGSVAGDEQFLCCESYDVLLNKKRYCHEMKPT